MLYAIICEDEANSLEKRLKTRPAHLERLITLQEQGRLVLAGPCPAIDAENPGEAGFSGSLIVADFPSWIDAKNWAEHDPYCQAGVYKNVTVKPFKQVFPQ